MLDKLSAAINSFSQQTGKVNTSNLKELYGLQNNAKLKFEIQQAAKEAMRQKEQEKIAELTERLYSKEASDAFVSLNSPNIHKYGCKIVIKGS